MPPIINAMQNKINILRSLCEQIRELDDEERSVPKSLLNEINELEARVNQIIEELNPKIQVASKEGQMEQQMQLINKAVELEIKLQEILFLVMVYNYKDVLADILKTIEGDEDD